MKINVPLGSKIETLVDKNIIKIKIKHTHFWIIGEKISTNNWNLSLINLKTGQQELLKEKITTTEFTLLSNVILKTQLPYNGKRNNDKKFIIKIINKNIKIYVNKQRKGSKIQINSKRRIKDGFDKKSSNKNRRYRSKNKRHN